MLNAIDKKTLDEKFEELKSQSDEIILELKKHKKYQYKREIREGISEFDREIEEINDFFVTRSFDSLYSSDWAEKEKREVEHSNKISSEVKNCLCKYYDCKIKFWKTIGDYYNKAINDGDNLLFDMIEQLPDDRKDLDLFKIDKDFVILHNGEQKHLDELITIKVDYQEKCLWANIRAKNTFSIKISEAPVTSKHIKNALSRNYNFTKKLNELGKGKITESKEMYYKDSINNTGKLRYFIEQNYNLYDIIKKYNKENVTNHTGKSFLKTKYAQALVTRKMTDNAFNMMGYQHNHNYADFIVEECPKLCNEIITDYLGITPKALAEFVNLKVIKQIKDLRNRNKTFINATNPFNKIYSHKFKTDIPTLISLNKDNELNNLVMTAIKDNQTNIIPIIFYFRKSPYKLKKMFGKALWKYLCHSSKAKNNVFIKWYHTNFYSEEALDLKTINEGYLHITSDKALYNIFNKIPALYHSIALNAMTYDLPKKHIEMIYYFYAEYKGKDLVSKLKGKQKKPWEKRYILRNLCSDTLDATRMHHQLYNRPYDYKNKSLELLRAEHDNLSEEYRKKAAEIRFALNAKEFPKNNLPNLYEADLITATKLTHGYELIEEGNKMHHCVASYVDCCLNGASVIYSITDTETKENATLEIKRVTRSTQSAVGPTQATLAPQTTLVPQATLAQIRGVCNQRPSAKIMKFAKDFIKSINKSSGAKSSIIKRNNGEVA